MRFGSDCSLAVEILAINEWDGRYFAAEAPIVVSQRHYADEYEER